MGAVDLCRGTREKKQSSSKPECHRVFCRHDFFVSELQCVKPASGCRHVITFVAFIS